VIIGCGGRGRAGCGWLDAGGVGNGRDAEPEADVDGIDDAEDADASERFIR
jgi:hypothetical protein